MTREELEYGMCACSCMYEDGNTYYEQNQLIECLTDLGLLQKPCEDAISRKSVLDLCDSKDSEYKVSHLKEDVECLPSVTPTRKKGKWIRHGEHCENLGVIPSGLGAYEWCSNCDCGIDVREWHRNHYNYCPNCGAEMESKDDNS